MQILITVNGRQIRATLADNPASRDFAAMLPLELTLGDHADTEKIADLPARLRTEGLPAGFDPSTGDITWYAPWGNLAIFRRDFGYARGLVQLGRIEGDLGPLSRPGAMTATIELLN